MTGFAGKPLYYETNPISETQRYIKWLQATEPTGSAGDRRAAPGGGGME